MASWHVIRCDNGERLLHLHPSGAEVVEIFKDGERVCYPLDKHGAHLSKEDRGFTGLLALWRSKRVVMKVVRRKHRRARQHSRTA